MYYRSDWPEIGFETPLSKHDNTNLKKHFGKMGCQIIQKKNSRLNISGILQKNEFESKFYKFPVYELFFLVKDMTDDRLNNGLLQKSIDDIIRLLFNSTICSKNVYIAAKLVKNEPFYNKLVKNGFDEVEHRRLYVCKIRELTSKKNTYSDDNIKFTNLSLTPSKRLSRYHNQIIDICEQAFKDTGLSRHFRDPFLLERQSGKNYILSVMDLNFQNVPLNHFLIAIDNNLKQIYGFSVVGKKPGLAGDVYSQLLSAIKKEYRGKGIYRGLTDTLYKSFPKKATLLNVTHVANKKIQRAYEESGRKHLSDTVILRRIFKN